jgi:hypothetical protein
MEKKHTKTYKMYTHHTVEVALIVLFFLLFPVVTQRTLVYRYYIITFPFGWFLFLYFSAFKNHLVSLIYDPTATNLVLAPNSPYFFHFMRH